MKRSFVLGCLFFGLGCGLHAQAVVDTTVCDVMKNPASFDGKMVRIKGTAVAGLDEFAIKDATQDPHCGFPVSVIWLSYPPGSKAKSGPVAMVEVQPAQNFAGAYKTPARTPVTLDKSKEFKQFDHLLAQPHQKGIDMCLGCAKYEVTATLVGRLDAVADATLKRDASGRIVGLGGFGDMNAYPARLVLQSVSDVTAKEVDYSKNDAIAGNDVPPDPTLAFHPADFDDPIGNAQIMASHMVSTSLAGQAVQRAVGAFGKPGKENDVTVTFGLSNEAAPQDEELGTRDSPDGVLFNCTFDRERLLGDSLNRAIVNIGEHVAELRAPTPGNEVASALILENDGWVVTSIIAAAASQKYLTLPGGYLFWDSEWPAAGRESKIAAALKDFLSNEALLSH